MRIILKLIWPPSVYSHHRYRTWRWINNYHKRCASANSVRLLIQSAADKPRRANETARRIKGRTNSLQRSLMALLNFIELPLLLLIHDRHSYCPPSQQCLSVSSWKRVFRTAFSSPQMDLIIPSLPDIGNGTFLDEKVQKDSNLDLRVWHVIFMGMGVFFSVGESRNIQIKMDN